MSGGNKSVRADGLHAYKVTSKAHIQKTVTSECAETRANVPNVTSRNGDEEPLGRVKSSSAGATLTALGAPQNNAAAKGWRVLSPRDRHVTCLAMDLIREIEGLIASVSAWERVEKNDMTQAAGESERRCKVCSCGCFGVRLVRML
jgi:hypothetical protein